MGEVWETSVSEINRARVNFEGNSNGPHMGNDIQ